MIVIFLTIVVAVAIVSLLGYSSRFKGIELLIALIMEFVKIGGRLVISINLGGKLVNRRYIIINLRVWRAKSENLLSKTNDSIYSIFCKYMKRHNG